MYESKICTLNIKIYFIFYFSFQIFFDWILVRLGLFAECLITIMDNIIFRYVDIQLEI